MPAFCARLLRHADGGRQPDPERDSYDETPADLHHVLDEQSDAAALGAGWSILRAARGGAEIWPTAHRAEELGSLLGRSARNGSVATAHASRWTTTTTSTTTAVWRTRRISRGRQDLLQRSQPCTTARSTATRPWTAHIIVTTSRCCGCGGANGQADAISERSRGVISTLVDRLHGQRGRTARIGRLRRVDGCSR